MSWREFLRNKKQRKDIADFSLHFNDNILSLQSDLANKAYQHGQYHAFKINDPKPRDIHKAGVRDRLVHHAICRILAPYFERYFIYDSYSCRLDKGTHRAINRLRSMARKVSRNNTRTAWILKGDIRKFFANIDHTILKKILKCYIADPDILWLLEQLIDSFHIEAMIGVGLPLGNLTSQLFINIYMNKFDQFMKRKLKARHYIRYADDFVVIHDNREYLEGIIPNISNFLANALRLSLHPKKLYIKTLASGIDFLGWVQFPHHRVLRTSTKRRILKRLEKNRPTETVASYLGLLTHGNTHKLRDKIFPRLGAKQNQRDKASKSQRNKDSDSKIQKS